MKGPEKRDKRLTVRIPEKSLGRLRAAALADGRSIADWALRAIEDALDRDEARRTRKALARA